MLVPEVGVEPTRFLRRWILSPLRLPIPPLGHEGDVILVNRTAFEE